MIKKIIIMVVMLLCLSSVGLAWDWDNVAEFNESTSEYGSITVTNALGFGSEVANYTLYNNSDFCYSDCYAEGKATLNIDDELFSEFNFKDINDNNRDLEFNVYIQVQERTEDIIPQHEQTCSRQTERNGSISLICEVEEVSTEIIYSSRTYWELYNYEELEAGDYVWRIEAIKPFDQNIDWIGSALGIDFNEWAWWNTDLVYRMPIEIENTYTDTLQNWHTIEVSGLDTTDPTRFDPSNSDNFAVVCDGYEIDKVFGNETDLATGGTKIYDASTGYGTTNTTFLFRLNFNLAALSTSSEDCFVYYGDNTFSSIFNNKSNIALLYDDFNRPDSETIGNGWVEGAGYLNITNNKLITDANNGVAVKQLDVGLCGTCEKYEVDSGINWGGTSGDMYYIGISKEQQSTGAGLSNASLNGTLFFTRSSNNRTYISSLTTGAVIKYDNSPYFYYDVPFTSKNIALDDVNRGDYLNYFNGSKLDWDGINSTLSYNDGTTKEWVKVVAQRTNDAMDYIMVRRYIDSPPIVSLGVEEAIVNIQATLISPIDDYLTNNNNVDFIINGSSTSYNMSNITLYVFNKTRYNNFNKTFGNSLLSWHTLDLTDADNLGIHDATKTNGEYINGVVGGAFYCNDVFSEVIIPSFDPTHNNETLSVFLWTKKATTPAALASPISQFNFGTSDRSWYLGYENNGKFEVRVTDDGAQTNYKEFQSTADMQNNVWHHIGFTWDTGVLKIYVDGVQQNPTVNRNDSFTQITNHDADIALGGLTSGGAVLNDFLGFIDDPRLYNITLTSEDVWDLYQSYNYTYTIKNEVIGNLTQTQQTFPTTLEDNSYYWLGYAQDLTMTALDWSETRHLTIDTQPPTVSITNPPNSYIGINTKNIEVNYTASDNLGLSNCWVSLNDVVNQTSGTCENFTIKNLAYTYYDLKVYANDTLGTLSYDTINITMVNLNSGVDYNSIALEQSLETINHTIRANLTDLNITQVLIYNNTNYTEYTFESTGTFQRYVTNLVIPEVEEDKNISFYREFLLNFSGVEIRKNTLVYNQTVENINIFVGCNESNATTWAILNLTFLHETNDTRINSNIEIDWLLWVNSSGIANNLSFQNDLTDINNTLLCIDASDGVDFYFANAQMQYSYAGYDPRDYYLYYTMLDNETDLVNLYNLQDTLTTGITFHIQDEVQGSFNGYYILVQRYDLSLGAYKLVAMGKTNEEGQDYITLEQDNAFYRFIIKDRDYNTVFTSSKQKITSNDLYITITESAFSEHWNDFENIEYSLTFDNASRSFNLVYNSEDGTITNGCLYVYELSKTGTNHYCDKCGGSASASLSCGVPETAGEYYASFYAQKNPDMVIETLSIIELVPSVLNTKWGNSGIFMVAMLSITIILGGIFSPVVSIVMLLLSVAILFLLGLLSIGIGTLMLLALIGGLIIAKLRS